MYKFFAYFGLNVDYVEGMSKKTFGCIKFAKMT
jgi:hypothetical protein